MKIKIFIKLLSISIIILLCSCNENNNEPISDCPEREKGIDGFLYRPAFIKGLVKSDDDLFFHTAGKIVRYSLTDDIFEVLELEFDSKFSSGYFVEDFDLCPYDRNQIVIYVSMFAPELESRSQLITYSWKEKTGKIEEILDLQNGIGYTNINWLANSTVDNNYIFFGPGIFIKNNIIYNLETDTHIKIDINEYYILSNSDFELKYLNDQNSDERLLILDGITTNVNLYDGIAGYSLDPMLGYYSKGTGDHQEPIIEVYEFNNYKTGNRIAELDIHNEHCLYASGTSIAFINEDHLVFSALKEESKYIPNKNFFDLYIYNFKTDELVDTIDVSRIFDFIN